VPLPSSDLTSGNVHLWWLDQSTSLPSGLYRQVNRSSQRTSRWTFPLVMSLDGSHMAIVKRLAMANHTHTWWHNMSPLKKRVFKYYPQLNNWIDKLDIEKYGQMWIRKHDRMYPSIWRSPQRTRTRLWACWWRAPALRSTGLANTWRCPAPLPPLPLFSSEEEENKRVNEDAPFFIDFVYKLYPTFYDQVPCWWATLDMSELDPPTCDVTKRVWNGLQWLINMRWITHLLFHWLHWSWVASAIST